MGMGDLQRFRVAQDQGEPSAYRQALTELSAGRKASHWIWFVLPKLAGLCQSVMAQRYGVAAAWQKPAPTWPTQSCGRAWRP